MTGHRACHPIFMTAAGILSVECPAEPSGIVFLKRRQGLPLIACVVQVRVERTSRQNHRNQHGNPCDDSRFLPLLALTLPWKTNFASPRKASALSSPLPSPPSSRSSPGNPSSPPRGRLPHSPRRFLPRLPLALPRETNTASPRKSSALSPSLPSAPLSHSSPENQYRLSAEGFRALPVTSFPASL